MANLANREPLTSRWAKTKYVYRNEYVFPFPHKVFLQSIHWVQSPLQLFRFLASIPVFLSCSAVYECLFMFPPLSPFPPFLSSIHSIGSSFLSVFSFLTSLSSTVFFSSSFHSCRVHNCITERLSPQLTLFSLHPHPVTFLVLVSRLDSYTYVDPRTEMYHSLVSTTEGNRANNGGKHQGWVMKCVEAKG